jgi:predicted AlkP superfamily pyrophosphatase or phosphodiesterase
VIPALLALIVAAPPVRAAVLPLSPPPRLVLVLSVDQMRFDYLTRFAPLYQGGFKAMNERGAVFRNAHQNYANSETGPGHSVILTGRYPSHSGIVANAWYDPLAGGLVNVVDDPAQSALGGTGRGASPVNLIGFTLGDILKKASPASRVVAVSLKDRAAVLMGGRRADAAFWYEGGSFVTSTYYMPALPPWAAAWNARHLADDYAGRSWTRLLPDEAVYRKYAGEDAVAGEWDNKDITFPHAVRGEKGTPKFYDELRRSPFADELTLSFVREAMQAYALGADDATDILAVSFSATDVIGHTYGPGSQEAMDQLLRLDGTVGELLAEAERRAGAGRTLVVLTADHGSSPLVETLRASGVDARRAVPAVVETAVRNALSTAFPAAGNLVAEFDTPNVYLDLPRLRATRLDRVAVEAVVGKALLGTGLVQAVYTAEQLLAEAPDPDPFLVLFKNSFFQPRSPQVMALLKPNIILDDRVGGTGHGTAHEYDRHVPVVFLGPGIRPGTYDAAVGPQHIAPTLGALLGLDYPLQDADRVLTEVWTPQPAAGGAR